mgnify:CR=1 FL=1
MPDHVAKLAIVDLPRPRAYSVVVLAVVGVLCASVVAVNVVVNPRAEFPSTAVPPLVFYNLQRKLDAYQALETPVSDLVLGTSRAGYVSGLPGRENETFNFAIVGSPPEDWRDLYRFFKREQGPPTNLVLVVDQNSFTDLFAPRIADSIEAEAILGVPPVLSDQVSLALRTLSVPYVLDTLNSLKFRFVTGYPQAAPPKAFPDFARSDLMEHYRAGRFSPAEASPTIDQQFERAFGPGSVHVPSRADALRSLLEEAVADGVVVDVVLPPIQPVALADLESRFPGFLEQTKNVRDALIAFCPSITVIDATGGEAVGIDPALFYNQTHLTKEGADQLMQAVAAGRADACAPATS